MSITPNEPANFTPTLGSYKPLSPFRFWCQKVLPLVYDDSLSYYELLNKVVDYLNKAMEDVETLHGDTDNLYQSFVQLQAYVNTYFSSLDVQEEIDNKLDEMATNGSLTELVAPLMPKLIGDWLSEHVTPTTPIVDDTLSISGAAADAKTTGDNINDLKSDLIRSQTYTPNLIGNNGNTLYPVDLEAGDIITVSTSDGSVFGRYGDYDLAIQFYDSNGQYINYYSLWSDQKKRTITLSDQFPHIGYISTSATPTVPLMVNIGATAKSYVPYITPLKYVVDANYQNLLKRASQYFAYFAGGVVPSINDRDTSVTISETTRDFRIYSRTGTIKATGILGTWTIAPFKMLVYDLDIKTLSVVDFGTSGNWVLLFSNNYGVYDGILTPFVSQNADFTEKTFFVESGTFHSSTKDMLKCTALAGQDVFVTVDVYSEQTTIQIFLSYADGTFSTGYTFSVAKNMYQLFHLEKELAKIGIAYDNTNGDTDVLIRFTAEPKVKGNFSTLNDIVSVSKIPYSQDKIKEFLSHYKNTGNSDTFIFFSDPHIMNQQSNMDTRLFTIVSESMAEVKKYADEVCPDAIISGGDWLNFGDTQDAACYKLRLVKSVCKKYFGTYNFHNLLGNHDTNYQGIEQDGSEANTGVISQNIINNIMYADEDTQKSYYSFKTPQTKYYCFDTGIDWDTAITEYQQEQLNWFANSLLYGNDEHIVVCMHIFSHTSIEADFGSDERPMTMAIVSIITAFNNRSNITIGEINYNYSNNTGVVHCILTGHTHFDKIYITSDNLPVICITDATDYSESKTKFDLGMLDYDNGNLHLVRINDEVQQRTVALR